MPLAMRSTLFLLTLVLVVALATRLLARSKMQTDTNVRLMVRTLREIENWDGKSRGASGERGFWQITPAVWAEFTRHPFAYADMHNAGAAEIQHDVATAYVNQIRQRLLLTRGAATPYMVALAWAAGLACAINHRPHRPTRAKIDYAARAQNLYLAIYDEHQKGTHFAPTAR